jgi:hypothetical protein
MKSPIKFVVATYFEVGSTETTNSAPDPSMQDFAISKFDRSRANITAFEKFLWEKERI